MKRRVLSGVVAAVAGAALAVLVAGIPSAGASTTPGTYTITACSPSTTSADWTATNQAAASLTTSNACGGVPAIGPDDFATSAISTTGGLFSEDQIGSTTPVPTGSGAGWTLAVPAGVQITAISYYGSWETDGGGWLSGLQINGVPQANDCQTNLNQTSPCAVYNNQLPQVATGLSASSLFFGVECLQVQGGATTCAPAPFGSHDVEAALYSAQVTLERTGGPVVQGEGGPLWGSGVVSGTVPVTFNASDPSGIANVAVLSDTGQSAASVQEGCTFTQVQACPQLPSGEIDVNTALLADGSHHVQLVVTNAGGDTTVVQGPMVVIDNNGPPAPTNLSATAAGTTSDVIDLAWANPSTPPQPISAGFVELCQASCGSPVQVSGGGAAQVTAPASGSYTVRVWLTDTAGKGSASSAATATVTVPAAQTQTVTTTTTVTVPAKTPTSSPCKSCPSSTKSTTLKAKPGRTCGKKCVKIRVRSVRWSAGELTIKLITFPTTDRLEATLYYRHARPRTVVAKVSRGQVRIRTGRPVRTVLVAVRGTAIVSQAIALPALPIA